jgi:hypothetical protein
MRHNIKIRQVYLIHILEGRRKFEVVRCDRDMQVGDAITFIPLEDVLGDIPEEYRFVDVPASAAMDNFEITYVSSGMGGLQQGHMIIGFERQSLERRASEKWCDNFRTESCGDVEGVSKFRF